ncbi:uncharacterized protein LOC130721189 isoform X5 [Lotus japonicus]|uniref:uncharacterized protein LOC130721189 isoform X5 n=1 Tax=Lotus japonicus TaxID=34305 RepID=UPI00258AC64B|nr:uncharacterized protein LOC130721189 isoform X5 [Lotus japonicus]
MEGPKSPLHRYQAPVPSFGTANPKAKRSKDDVSSQAPTRVYGTSSLTRQPSLEEHSMLHMEPPLHRSQAPAPSFGTLYPKAKRSKGGVSSQAPTRVYGTSSLTRQPSLEEHYMPHMEPPLPHSQAHVPSFVVDPREKRSKDGVSSQAPTRVYGTSSLTRQPSLEEHYMPHMEPPLPHSQAHVPSFGTVDPKAKRSSTSSSTRESTRLWTVQAIDEHGNQKTIQLTITDVFDMPKGQLIIVPFDRQRRACGQAAALLSGACGRIVLDPNNVPINFESWKEVVDPYKDDCFNTLKNLFHFQTLELFAKRYCLLIMGRKYRNGKLKLWNSKYDPSYSRGYLIANVPDGVPKDQWSSFVDYHLKQEYQELCQRNSEARKKQTIPHTGGSKLLSRRQYEMEMELGREVSRGEMYIATHKKSNGSYVNEDARSVGVLVEQELSQTLDFSEVSKNDALAKVLGPDHSGCVRGLGVGALHSVAFRSTTTQMKNSISSAESTQLNEELNSLKTKLAASDENIKTLQTVLFAYMQMKEGHIAANLAALFGNFTKMDQGNEEANPTQQGESSLDSNYV